MKIPIASILARAPDRPVGYVDEVLGSGTVDGDQLVLDEAVYLELCRRYGHIAPALPRLGDLLEDYEGSTRLLANSGHAVAPWDVFWRRLLKCRACPRRLWDESGEAGIMRCNDVRRACSRIRLWAAGTVCGLPGEHRQW